MGKYFKEENNDAEQLKQKAAKTAINGVKGIPGLFAKAGNGLINGAKAIRASFGKGFGLVTGKVADAGSAVGLSPLVSNIAVILVMTIVGSTTVSYIQEENYLNDLRYNTVWDDEDPCAGFTVEETDLELDTSDAAQMAAVRQLWSVVHWYVQHSGSDLSWDEVDVRVAGMVGCFSGESGLMPMRIEATTPSNTADKIRELSSGTSTGAVKVNGEPMAYLGGMNLSAFSNWSETACNTNGGSPEGYIFDASQSASLIIDGNLIATIQGDGGWYCGLGLGQWTESRALLLLAYSELAGAPWYEMTTQTAFILTGDSRAATASAYFTGGPSGYSGNGRLKTDEHTMDPQETCYMWANCWEGTLSWDECESRRLAAQQWYSMMKSWSQSSIDQSAINSVVSILSKVTANADLDASMDVMGNCGDVLGLGNLTLAEYASIASYDGKMSDIYSGERLAHYDNGTPLYQYVVRQCGISSGYGDTDAYGFQDCGKGVASIIRWAGADDNMPSGTRAMEDYMSKHRDRWQLICDSSDPVSVWDEQVQPGDVFVVNRGKNHHIYIYCGEEAWLRFHLGPDDIDANGHSFCSITYAPSDIEHGGQTVEVPVPRTICTSCSSSYTPDGSSDSSRSMAGQGTNFNSARSAGYAVYRNIQPEVESQYANIVDMDRLIVGASPDGHVSTGVVANGSLIGGQNTQCTVLPDYTLVIDGAEVVVTNRYHFSWQSVRSNMYGSDDRIRGCPDYAIAHSDDYNIHPSSDTVARN